MPIYAYKCESCGFAKDVLQKLSDTPLTECPSCGNPTFQKQLTAAGFQLKGSGWYATDFKNGGNKPAADSGKGGSEGGDGKSESKSDKQGESKSEGKSESNSESKAESKTDVKPEAKKADAPAVKKPDSKPAPSSSA